MFTNIYFDFPKGKIHLWEYHNGTRVHIQEDYEPYCFIPDVKGDYQDLKGKKCKKKYFKSWFEQKEFIDKLETFEGDIRPEDRFLIDRYYKIKEFTEIPKINIHYIDIECKADEGFPSATNIDNGILAITIYSNISDKYITFGLKPDYIPGEKGEYIYCSDEQDLFRQYFKWHRENFPDVITGWNVDGFDIPYILNRGKYILGETFIKKYSPIGVVQYYNERYSIAGISVLDYLDLYKSFSPNQRESYSLNYISFVELKEEKLKFDGSLKDLWKKDWQKFIDYNIKDVYLVTKLEEKLGYLRLVQAQAYACRIPFEKYGASIKKFDNYLMSILKERNIVVPTLKRQHAEEIPGGFVSEVKPGFYKSVVSYDFTSLYPHIIMAMNISPETFILKLGDYIDFDLTKINDTDEFKVGSKSISGKQLKEIIVNKKYILAPNGILYDSKEGFIPSIIKDLYAKRKQFKDSMMFAKKQYKETGDEKYKIQEAMYDSFQYNYKILLNSAYGVLANANYRFFSLDAASTITLTGQKLIKYAGQVLNEFFREKFKVKNDVVLYSDTDSGYVNFEEVLSLLNITEPLKFIELVNNLNDKVLKKYLDDQFKQFSKNHNIEKNIFDLKRELICTGMIFTQKKKYAAQVIDSEGFTYKEPELKVKGLEIVRSSTPSFCREKIKELVELILKTQDKQLVTDRVKDIRKEFREADITDISFPRSLSGLKEYIKDGMATKGTPMQVRAANNYNFVLRKYKLEDKYEPLRDGDKLKFIYLKENNPIKENIIAFKDSFPMESDLSKYIDKDLQFEKSFLSPVLNITKAVGWELNLDSKDISQFF